MSCVAQAQWYKTEVRAGRSGFNFFFYFRPTVGIFLVFQTLGEKKLPKRKSDPRIFRDFGSVGLGELTFLGTLFFKIIAVSNSTY